MTIKIVPAKRIKPTFFTIYTFTALPDDIGISLNIVLRCSKNRGIHATDYIVRRSVLAQQGILVDSHTETSGFSPTGHPGG